MNTWKLSILALAGAGALAVSFAASGCTVTTSSGGLDGGGFTGTDSGTDGAPQADGGPGDGGTEASTCAATTACPVITQNPEAGVSFDNCGACDQCMATTCCDTATACFSDSECLALTDCIDGCATNDAGIPPDQCASSCELAHPNGKAKHDALFACATGGDAGAGCKTPCGL